MNYQLENVKMSRRLGAGLLLAALVLSGVAGTGRADDGKGNNNNNNNNNNNATEVRLRTRLAGAAINGKTPGGQADFRMEASRNRSRLNVEVENVNLPAGTALTVVITHSASSSTVGMITLNGLGEGELELNSQDGDTVPAIVTGDMVAVKNGATTILTGVF